MSNAAHKAPRVATRTQSRQKTKTQRRIALMLLAGLFASGGWPARCSPIVKPRMRENGSTRRPPSPRNSSLPTVCRRHTAATTYPDHLVNGGFDYPDMSMLGARDSLFVYISRKDLSYARKDTQDKTNPADPPRFALPSGFDASGFAWHSTQGNTGLANEKPDDVQVWTVYDGGNHYAELAAAQTGTAIYQDIATEPGVMYKWSLRHASLDEAYLDKMSVMIGTPGKETAQDAVRVTSNGHGDKTGPVGKIIATRVANHRNAQSWNKETDHTGQWESYEGTYIATGKITRFTFRNVDSAADHDGNLLDDIIFAKAYPLSYDGNGNTNGNAPQNK